MTNAEAIEILKNLGKSGPYEQYEATCMAIAALEKQKPMTNAGRIRSMTDEELSQGIVCCPYIKDECDCFNILCRDCILEWLKQEVRNNT